MKSFIFAIIILLLISTSFSSAQRKGGDFDRANMPKNGVLSGKIVDAETGHGLTSATLYLYSLRDSSLVSGALTNKDGSFKIEKLPFGRFYLRIKYIGYEKMNVEDLKITPRSKNVDLGNIEINIEAVSMDGVEVSAERMQIEYKVDKKIITPNKDITSAGGTAVDVLENVPSVSVDIEGNVSLRGSSSFTVFINGKPSILDANDALDQISASAIQHIELITNPSVKYDPDGIAGIINIILKKQEESGTSGMLDISTGSYDNYRLNSLLNYKINGFNIFGGVNYSKRSRLADGTNTQESSINRKTVHLDYDNNMNRNHTSYDLKGGMSYDVDDMTTISIDGRYGAMGFFRDYSSNMIELIQQQDVPDSSEYAKNISQINRDRDYYAVNLDFVKRFDDFQHTLTASIYYSNRAGDGNDKTSLLPTDEHWNMLDIDPEMTRSIEIQNSSKTRIKVDYVNPISKNSMFEAGTQLLLEPEDETNTFEEYDPLITQPWVVNDYYSSDFEFTRNIASIYSTYSNELIGLSYKLGLRGEYTDRIISIFNSGNEYQIDRFDLFPSVHISSKINDDNQIYTSYGRRIQRPRGRDLEPSKMYRDQYNYRIGNPDLEPEYINSFELGYLRYFGKSMLSFEAYYRQTINKITRVQTLETDGVIKHTIENLNQDYSAGLEIMANLDLLEWFSLNASIDMYQYWFDGTIETGDVDNDAFVWGGRLNSTFKLTPTTRFQANTFYRGPSISAQGKNEGMWGANLALRQDIFNRSMSIVFQVRDVFSTYKREFTIRQEDFYFYMNMTPKSPTFTLTFSYKFNNFEKKKMDANGDGEIDVDTDF